MVSGVSSWRAPGAGTRQTQYHEALPPSANVQSHLTSSFADDGGGGGGRGGGGLAMSFSGQLLLH